jgi:MoaA/NifB/PqqE/SkfB family radical SAM enzyme
MEVFDAALRLIPADAGGLRIDLNGHGETTTHPDWLRMARAATASGASVTMLSNFAKLFDADEIRVLATMSVIQISLDTTNDTLLRRLRRKVSLGTILRNLHLVRMRAREANLKPEWAISCGVYDKSITSLRDLAWFAVTAGFDSVTFWNLVKYPDVLGPGTMHVKPIAELPKDEQSKAVTALSEAIRILEDHGVNAEVAGDFVDWPSGRWSRTS